MRDLQIRDPDRDRLGPCEQCLLVHIGQQQKLLAAAMTRQVAGWWQRPIAWHLI